MKISSTMNLGELAERMGPDATEQDAACLRDLLWPSHGEDISDIPEHEWLMLCEQAARTAAGH